MDPSTTSSKTPRKQIMAKVPVKAKPVVKKPAAKAAKYFVPPVSLKPGEKKKLAIKQIKVKLDKLNRIEKELDKLQSAQAMAGPLGIAPTSFANQALTDKMAEFHALLDAEQTKQLKLLAIAQKEIMDKQSGSVDPLIAIIEKECSQALAAFKSTNKVLLRGASSKTNPPIFHGRSHENRKVLNSTDVGQQIYDYVLTKMGITALRSNSIFATTDEYQAGEYGNAIYAIIPKNGFAFSWALHEPDLVIDDIDSLLKENVLEKIIDSIDKYVENNPKLSDGSGTEWYERLQFEGYEKSMEYLKEIKFPNYKNITLDKLIDYKSIKENMGPTNKDFNKALTAGGEVLINGEYYGIDVKKYAAILKNVMGLNIPSDR
jgi:hypothetical protein